MTSLTRRARAKINLTLDIGPRRADGYHDIRSLMQTLALHDTLTVTLTPEHPGVLLEVIGEESEGVPPDETNLAYRAAARLQEMAAAYGGLPRNRSGLRVLLHKRIPSQAGLGGGSSDAAAMLLAADQLFDLALSPQRLADIAIALGADVPFFLHGGTALVEGLGERVTPQPTLSPPWPLVVVKPPFGVSTGAAYAALDSLPNRRPGQATAAWLRGERQPSNDFEAVILPSHAEIAKVYNALCWTAQTGECFTPVLCGSGAALFCRTVTLEAAQRTANQIEALGLGKAWVTTTDGSPT